MTDGEREELQALIDTALAETRDSIAYLEEATKPIAPSVSLGRLTRMEALGEKGVNEASLARARQRLERLINARKRLDEGTYGRCVRCGGDIPVGRLRA